jgi:hypothetical protein
MGARSSPEGSRLAVGRYGLPVRERVPTIRQRPMRLLMVAVFAPLAIAAGCSKVSGSKSSTPGRPAACALVAKLDTIANTVAQADVRDPDTFNATLQAAVRDYASNVRRLRAVAPSDLSASLARVEADVKQLRFDAAVTDRAQLDAYAARSRGRVGSPASTSSTVRKTPSGSPTTVPTSPTSTTLPSVG